VRFALPGSIYSLPQLAAEDPCYKIFVSLRGATISRFGRGYAAPWDMTPVLSCWPGVALELDKSGDISHHAPHPSCGDAALCEQLNATETVFPGAELRLVYKVGSNHVPRDQEVWGSVAGYHTAAAGFCR
jgi:hypothetical protein